MNATQSVIDAATYIRWCGYGSNCLRRNNQKFQEAVLVVQAAPALLRVHGPRGECDILAVVGNDLAYRDVLAPKYDVSDPDVSPYDHAGWGCGFAPWSLGGLSQPVASYRLAEGSPSQYMYGLYAGGAFALTAADAKDIGAIGRQFHRDDPGTEALFGANVSEV